MRCGMLAYGFLEAHLRAFVLLTICLYLPSCSPSQQASSTVKAESAENKGGEDESEDDELEQEGVLVQAPKAGSPEAVVQGLIAASRGSLRSDRPRPRRVCCLHRDRADPL